MPSFGAISELPVSALPVAAGGGTAYTLDCDAGAYVISGQDATLNGVFTLDCEAGFYAISGHDATLNGVFTLDCEAGAYVIAGQDASLDYVPAGGTAYTLDCDAGAYVIAGQDIDFVYTPASGYTDTHDGYWTKKWLERHKKPKIEEVIEYVIEQPQEAVAEVRAAVERVYPQIDYREVKSNVKLQRFIANQLMKAIKDYQDDEDMMTFMMMT